MLSYLLGGQQLKLKLQRTENRMEANRAVLPPLLLATALITYRGAKNGTAANNPVPHLPLPSQFVGAFFAFGLLSLASGQASRPAVLIAWGLDVAILLNFWNAGGQVNQTNTAIISSNSSPSKATVKKG